MKGFIKRTVAIFCLGGAATCGGCCQGPKLSDCYDNCWLERYSFQANQSATHIFAAQVNNGHVLDQTVFTYHFEAGTDKLTKGGQDHLAYLARRRPEPDCKIYLQTAQDMVYDPAAPEQYSIARAELDNARVAAIQRFLIADTSGRPFAFDVVVHDAPTQGLYAVPIGTAFQKHINGFQGTLPYSTSGGTPAPSGGSSSNNNGNGAGTPH